MRSMRFFAPIFGAAVLSAPAVAGVSVTVGDFDLGQWAFSTHEFGPNGGSGSLATTTSGNPDSALIINNSCGSNFSGAWNAAVYAGLGYTPSISGPLTELAFSIDTRHVSSLQAVSFIVEQDGEIWRVGYFINTPSWTTWQLPTVTSADFAPLTTNAPALPNFIDGGTIRFGISSGNSSAGGSGYSTTGHYDNFSVSFVPGVGALPMLALGLVTGRRRRA